MFKNFLGKQFIDVIEWNEEELGVLAYRYPMQDQEIQNGAKLTVRESQMALFINEGRIADKFESGLYTLNTNTLPVLTNLLNWDKMFASPFKSDVYFFSTREQTDQRWGTQAPIVVRDNMYGAIRIRAHGIYSYRVSDPAVFFKKISGTQAVYRASQLEGQLCSLVLTALASELGSSGVAFLDMAANQLKFSEILKELLAKHFAEYGLNLNTFFVQSLTLPEELTKYLDKSVSIKMVGDMRTYMQFNAAESLPLAAQNEGGIAGAGAGLGMGVGAGATIGQAFNSAFSNSNSSANLSSDEAFETLNKLHELLKKGIITQEEFDAKKTELLKNIK